MEIKIVFGLSLFVVCFSISQVDFPFNQIENTKSRKTSFLCLWNLKLPFIIDIIHMSRMEALKSLSYVLTVYSLKREAKKFSPTISNDWMFKGRNSILIALIFGWCDPFFLKKNAHTITMLFSIPFSSTQRKKNMGEMMHIAKCAEIRKMSDVCRWTWVNKQCHHHRTETVNANNDELRKREK